MPGGLKGPSCGALADGGWSRAQLWNSAVGSGSGRGLGGWKCIVVPGGNFRKNPSKVRKDKVEKQVAIRGERHRKQEFWGVGAKYASCRREEINQAWQRTHVSPAFREWRQEGQKFKTRLGYIRSHLKTNQ